MQYLILVDVYGFLSDELFINRQLAVISQSSRGFQLNFCILRLK